MEYTRFPGAADEPPRADALRGLTSASSPPAVSHLSFAGIDDHYRLSVFRYSGQLDKRFNLFIIRRTASLIGTKGGDSCGNSMSLETPECEAHGGSSHARGKRPPAVEINSFSSYPKNTDLRTTIYFAPERLLGYFTDTSCTSRGQEPP